MTNLEFIKKEIKDIKNVLDEELDDEDALFIHSLIGDDYISRLNDELQQLEQIKTKLEAWEDIKLYFIEKPDGYLLRIYDEDNGIYDKLKKALEVEDNNEN